MNTAVTAKFAKSRYQGHKDVFLSVFDAAVLAIELVFVGIMLIIRFTGNSEDISDLMLYLILGTAYFYVLFEAAYIKCRQKKLGLKLLQNHHNYIRRGALALIAAAGIIIVLIILTITNGKIYSAESNYGLCIWYMAMIGLAWTDGYYIKAVTLFGSESYCSGKYEINYGVVTDVKEISKHTAGIGFYDIYFVEIYSGGKLIGMDKLFSDEYNFLLEKINRQNN